MGHDFQVGRWVGVIALAGALVHGGVAHANNIAFDPFLDGGGTPDTAAGEYITVGPNARLLNQQPTIAGFTADIWGAPVTNPGVIVGTSNYQADIGTLDLGYGFESGGKAKFIGSDPNIDDLTRYVRRDLAPYTPSSTYYMSAIINPGTIANKPGFAAVGFSNPVSDGQITNDQTAGQNFFGALLGFEGDGAGGVDMVVKHRKERSPGVFEVGNDVITPAGADLENLSWYVILKADVAVGADTITYWVNPTDLTSEAGATATALATGSFTSFSFNDPANADITQATLAALDWGGSFFFDEIGFGSAFPTVAASITGDADCDGDVDLDDFNLLAANFGQIGTVGKEVGDFDGDGDTDLDDFNLLAANFGTGTSESPAGLPEPGTVVLVLLGGAAALHRRR